MSADEDSSDDEDTDYEVDLHGYSTDTAMRLADALVEEAHLNGFETITFIHGAPDVRYYVEVSSRERGYIKWALRSSLRGRAWDRWARGPRSRKHHRDPGSLTVALRPNPAPRRPRVFMRLPPLEY